MARRSSARRKSSFLWSSSRCSRLVNLTPRKSRSKSATSSRNRSSCCSSRLPRYAWRARPRSSRICASSSPAASSSRPTTAGLPPPRSPTSALALVRDFSRSRMRAANSSRSARSRRRSRSARAAGSWSSSSLGGAPAREPPGEGERAPAAAPRRADEAASRSARSCSRRRLMSRSSSSSEPHLSAGSPAWSRLRVVVERLAERSGSRSLALPLSAAVVRRALVEVEGAGSARSSSRTSEKRWPESCCFSWASLRRVSAWRASFEREVGRGTRAKRSRAKWVVAVVAGRPFEVKVWARWSGVGLVAASCWK